MKSFLKLAVLMLGAAGLLAPTIAPAAAQEWRREEWRDRELARQEAFRERERDREWRDHERRAAEWRRLHEAEPSYGYAYVPPPVVYSAPPAASFSLTIPFDVR